MTKAPGKASVHTKRTGWVLIVSSVIGLAASLMLAIEEYHHLKNPSEALNCDLNPLIGCGSILDTWQGHVLFGVPNQLFGLMAFSVLATIGVLLVSKVQLPRWIFMGLQAGAVAGIISVLWFIYQSLFVLNHLCPYCMITWIVTFIASWYITVYNLERETWKLPARFDAVKAYIIRHHLDILITLFVVLVLGILLRFREFFFG